MSGLDGVGGILDDLIVTGSNDAEHLRNLEGTLKVIPLYCITHPYCARFVA